VIAALSGVNTIIRKAGPGDSAPLQDVWRDRAVILAQRMHARGVGAYDTFAVTDEIGRYTRRKPTRQSESRRRCLRASRRLAAGRCRWTAARVRSSGCRRTFFATSRQLCEVRDDFMARASRRH